MLPLLPRFLRRWSSALLGAALLVASHASQAQPRPDNPPILLDPLIVGTAADEDEAGYDPTGMGMMEAETHEAPFSNDIIWDELPEDDVNVSVDEELMEISGASRAEIATSGVRLRLRGFPTPQLRDGYAQTGVPEILNVRRVQNIQGPLIPVLGRGAPGGIRNFITYRPRARPETQLEVGVGRDEWEFEAETSRVLVAKKAWMRAAIENKHEDGPQTFAWEEATGVTGAVTVRPTRRTSAMLQLDFERLRGNPSPGMPQYRQTANSPVLGPYRPLAFFHAYGPNARVEKQVSSATLQIETQLTPKIALRTSLQGLQRELEEESFTRGIFQLDTGTFGGVREPLFETQPSDVLAAQVDATARFTAAGLEHKLFVAVENVRSRTDREERALAPAARDALPADVLTFDPAAPNYFRPAYSPATYSRRLTDRREDTEYRAVAVSDRTAIADGRLVVTAGARYDAIRLHLRDHRPGATFPMVRDRAEELTWHAGANVVVRPGRLLAFANASSAFEPSTRIDARTGRIQGNELTQGFELGLKGLLPRRLNYTLLYFNFTNDNISRRNPRYNDPVLDPQLMEPELLAAGEEAYRGGLVDLRLQLSKAWRMNANATYTSAETVRSPDLPQEEGRPLARLPQLTGGVSTRYVWQEGPLDGFSVGLGATYTDNFVARYADATRAFLAYPSVTQLRAHVNYAWEKGRSDHSLGLRVRNLTNRDLLALLDQPGRGRELSVEYELEF